MFICSKCKNELMDGTKFCPHCGKKQNITVAQNAEQSPFSSDFQSPTFDPNYEEEKVVQAVYRDDVLQVYDEEEAEQNKKYYNDDDDYQPNDPGYVHQYVAPPVYQAPPKKKVSILPFFIITGFLSFVICAIVAFSAFSGLVNDTISVVNKDEVYEAVGETAEDPIVWSNPQVEKMVRDMLDKQKGDITLVDLWGIDELYIVSGKMISSWESYSNFLSKNDYNLGAMGSVSDLTDLKNFNNLNSLNILNMNVGNCDFSDELYDLRFIQFNDCKINSFKGLEQYNKIYSIDLTDIYSDNWDSMPSITSLERINISGGNITNLDAFSECTSLESIYIYNSPITDFSMVENMMYLEYLNLSNIKITDIPDLSKIRKLSSLTLYECGITDITFLSELKSLNYLTLNDNGISDISALESLVKLQSLDLSYNQIEDISVLANLKSLESLSLNDNIISDISPLTDLEKLEYLYIRDNLITDFSPLDGKKCEIRK